MPTTKIYLIRHSEAEGNLYRRAQGQYDSLLTARAVRQIEALTRRFEGVHLDAVYSSDLYRTRETVRPLAETRGLPLRLMPALREINMGRWENRPWGELPFRWAKEYWAWENTPWDLHIPEGENGADVTERMLSAVRQIAAECPGQTVAAASHGCVLRYLLCAVMGMPMEQIKEVGMADNTAVSLIEVDDDGAMRMIFKNDNSHLSPELSTFRHMKKDAGVDWRDTYMYFAPWSLEMAEDLEPFCGEATIDDVELFLQMRKGISKDPLSLWVGFVKSNPVGLIWTPLGENKTAHIRRLYVRPERAGQGFEEQLLGQAITTLRDRGQEWLQVEPTDGERVVYEQLGFKPCDNGLTMSLAFPKK